MFQPSMHVLWLFNYRQGRNQTKMLGGLSQGRVQGGFSGDEFEGEARVEGAKRPRAEGEARTECEARDEAGGGVWGGGSVSPSPEIFSKL